MIYVLLQVAFIGAVDPSMIVNGWGHLNFNSPFADLAIALGINWLVLILYADAFVSPSGTGITYTATTSRMIYGMEKTNTCQVCLAVCTLFTACLVQQCFLT